MRTSDSSGAHRLSNSWTVPSPRPAAKIAPSVSVESEVIGQPALVGTSCRVGKEGGRVSGRRRSKGPRSQCSTICTHRLRQLAVGVPDADVVHVACDVEVAGVLVPGGNGAARRRARQRRRHGAERRGDLHLSRVVVLAEQAHVAVGCGKGGGGGQSSSARSRARDCDAHDAVRSSASETSLMKYMLVIGAPEPLPLEKRLRRLRERQSHTL